MSGSGGRPDARAIRRALAECMTLSDIDDALGWTPGTARRYRWRDPERGGLPPSDAELAGQAIWFRDTIERWRGERPARRPRPTRTPERDLDRTGAASATVVPEPPDSPSGPAAQTPPEPTPEPTPEPQPEPQPEPGQEVPGPDPAPTEQLPEVPAPPAEDLPDPAPAAAREIRSGFEVEPGQQVLAHVRRAWRSARVIARDRGTVVVGYAIDGTALGARQQRVTIDRVRVPPP